jgi:E3 ubiquitin-protein ligase SIAH1
MMEADVASCAVPIGAAVEEGMALYVPPPMLSGPSKEMHLRVRIDVVDPAPAPQRSASSRSPRV